jgi:hypothetical protein
MIGRQVEQEEFFRNLESEQSEFVVIFGRCSVGKTYLVRKYLSLFQKKYRLSQNIDILCFKEKGRVTDEFVIDKKYNEYWDWGEI